MNTTKLSERDICSKFITPAVLRAGWDLQTQIREEVSFTLIDFRKATNHFADPDFDGEPVQIYEPGEDETIIFEPEIPDIELPSGEGSGNQGDTVQLLRFLLPGPILLKGS